MKSTRKLLLPPPPFAAEEKVELHAAHLDHHFKERQILPMLSGLKGSDGNFRVPANELEFTNFYHL
jgi:hypothetical protein